MDLLDVVVEEFLLTFLAGMMVMYFWSMVMYRPSRDLKGIPSADFPIVCLTGYQGQDRDDVMVSTTLSIAQFNKVKASGTCKERESSREFDGKKGEKKRKDEETGWSKKYMVLSWILQLQLHFQEEMMWRLDQAYGSSRF